MKGETTMQAQIIGISGSPIKNSNTDRLIQAVLESSGLKSEFVKLSKISFEKNGLIKKDKDSILSG